MLDILEQIQSSFLSITLVLSQAFLSWDSLTCESRLALYPDENISQASVWRANFLVFD